MKEIEAPHTIQTPPIEKKDGDYRAETKQENLIVVSDKLKNLGDYVLSTSQQGEPQITIVTAVERTRGWVHCNPGVSDRRLNQVVSYPIDTPISATFSKEEFLNELERNKDLMIRFRLGCFDELVTIGFIHDLAKEDAPIYYSTESLKIIDHLLDGKDFTDGTNIYYTSRALVAKVLLDTSHREGILENALIAKKKDWIPSLVPANVAIAFTGDDELRNGVYAQGKDWATGQDSRFAKRIGGWAMLAAAAETDSEKKEGYDIVMKSIDTPYIDMAANVLIAAAILANGGQRREIYSRAQKEHQEAKLWAIDGGTLIAMAVASPKGEERTNIFQMANDRLKKGYDYRYTKKDMLVLALTAQTQEEKNTAFKLAELYSDEKAWNNLINGWAILSLGILSSNDRERALRSVAALMESDD